MPLKTVGKKMKITKEYFNQVIKEETEKILSESFRKAFLDAKRQGKSRFTYTNPTTGKTGTFGTKMSTRANWKKRLARKKYLKTIARATRTPYKYVKNALKSATLPELRKDYVISKVELGKKLNKSEFNLAKTLDTWPSSKYPTMSGDYSFHKTTHKSTMPQTAKFYRSGKIPNAHHDDPTFAIT